MNESTVLVINTGSSSLKFGLYAARDGEEHGEEHAVIEGSAESIGGSSGGIKLNDSAGKVLYSDALRVESYREALSHAARLLAEFSPGKPSIIGHRVVHGGPRLVTHQPVTPALLQELKACVHFAPLHIPLALELIEEAARHFPEIPQFACFDTAFHRTLPESVARFPIPRAFFDEGIRRYGFHGLSYESIVRQFGTELPGRTVIAHLGSGASLVALKDGRSIDTTMGLTPTGGIPMATRSGDLDPGVLLYLLRTKNMNADSLESLLNHDSGLKAISDGKGDMRDLEAAANAGDRAAELAIEIFCGSISRVIAAYTVALGGLDLIVFTGGIGEHSVRVRREVCRGLAFYGLGQDDLDERRLNGKIRVLVVPTQEDREIARHCRLHRTLTPLANEPAETPRSEDRIAEIRSGPARP